MTVYRSKARGVLDIVSTSSLYAFSKFRLLRRAYKGPLIRVRRSSDNAELDIYPRGMYLDVKALMDFAGASSLFIRTWYDQSGNGFDLAQTTTANQPRIVNAGTMDKLNNVVSSVCDASNDRLERGGAFGLSGSPALTSIATFKYSAATGNTVPLCIGNSVGAGSSIGMYFESAALGMYINYVSRGLRFDVSPAITSASTWTLIHAAGGSTSTGTLRRDGAACTLNNTAGPATAVNIGSVNSLWGGYHNGTLYAPIVGNLWMGWNAELSGNELLAAEAEGALHAA